MVEADSSVGDGYELDSDDIVTVGQLNSELSTLVESATDLHHDYVVGDVTDDRVANGHLHFDLVHDGVSIHCVVFGVENRRLSTMPDSEMQVAVRGDLSFYEARGSCSIIVSDVVEVGSSQYQQIYEQNRETLAADGLLDDDRERDPPELPGTVGLVTAADSDARTDAVTAIHSRYPDVDIRVHHATMQGPNAMEEILAGISALDRDATVEVIVLTRGGGADETLRVFNETPICRVIANTDTPVVVGIGHEDDRVLAGDVADLRVMTPTHVGEIVPRRATYEERVADLREDLDSAYGSAVELTLGGYAVALDNQYDRVVSQELQRLDGALDSAYTRRVETTLNRYRTELDHALEARKRAEAHEREKAEVADEAYAEARAELSAKQRVYRVALVVLVVLLLALAVYTFLLS